ncbi:MAG TPA: hypothetical protein VIV60_24220 [Polyangiaceae bacterium]
MADAPALLGMAARTIRSQYESPDASSTSSPLKVQSSRRRFERIAGGGMGGKLNVRRAYLGADGCFFLVWAA